MSDVSIHTVKATLQRLPWGAPASDVVAAIARDGAVVLEAALTPEQVAQVNRDLDACFGTSTYAGKGEGERQAFLGMKTKRVAHVVAKSGVYCNDFVGSSTFLSYAKAFLKDVADEVAIIASQGIEIFPGQGEQILHRDHLHYPVFERFGRDGPEILGNMMLALTDFTEENGATRVIPGSHLWDDFNRPVTYEMSIAAEMNAGDVLYFGGKTIHGGGRNCTEDRVRRSIATGVTPYYLAFGSEEAFAFAVPIERVRQMPSQVQTMIGFRSSRSADGGEGGCWRFEMGNLEDHIGL